MAERTCTVDGCDRDRGPRKLYCNMHYQRSRKHGDPLTVHKSWHGYERCCSIDGCNRKHQARGLCKMHHGRLLRNGDPLIVRTGRENWHPTPCSIDDCDNQSKSRGYCDIHYHRWWKTGDPLGIRPQRWDGYEKPSCSVDRCDRLAHARGRCTIHGPRFRRHGDPEAGRRLNATGSDEDRFLSFVDVDEATGCWVWNGARTTAGYGEFFLNSDQGYAHRWSYEHYVESIAEGFHVDHLCRVHACVNPDHLEAVTPQENTFRGLLARRLEATGRAWSISLLRQVLAVIDEAGLATEQVA